MKEVNPSQIEGTFFSLSIFFCFQALKLVSLPAHSDRKEMGMDSSVIIVCKEVSYL